MTLNDGMYNDMTPFAFGTLELPSLKLQTDLIACSSPFTLASPLLILLFPLSNLAL